MKNASSALTRSAALAAVTPQHVRRTDQPVFVGHVELCGHLAAHRKQTRPSHKADVVKVDDIETTIPNDFLNLRPVNGWGSKLVRREGAEDSKARPQTMHCETLGLCQRLRGGPLRQLTPRIDVTDHLHLVPPLY